MVFGQRTSKTCTQCPQHTHTDREEIKPAEINLCGQKMEKKPTVVRMGPGACAQRTKRGKSENKMNEMPSACATNAKTFSFFHSIGVADSNKIDKLC